MKGLAMASVAFAAVLTSCSKEEFNVKVTPSNAKIYFNPSVIDPVAGATVAATFTGAETITGTPNIAAGSTTITATAASGATGSTTVAYDAVEAGATATYSPIIILDNGLFKAIAQGEPRTSTITKDGNVTAGHTHNNSKWFLNQSDYSAKFTAEWEEKAKIKAISWSVNSGLNSNQFQAYLKSLEQEVVKTGTEEFTVSAWAMFRTEFTITTTIQQYQIVSSENEDFVIGYVWLENPLAEVKCEGIEQGIPGHAYEHGHSHGAGENAGGGIGWAE